MIYSNYFKKSLVRNSANGGNNGFCGFFYLKRFCTCHGHTCCKILKVTISFSTSATAQDPAKLKKKNHKEMKKQEEM